MTFDTWLHEVNELCLAWYGIAVRDWHDVNMRDAFDEATDPETFMLSVAASAEAIAPHDST